MTILNKTHNEEGAASCLVVGAENKALYILDPAAFTYLSRVGIEYVSSVCVFVSQQHANDTLTRRNEMYVHVHVHMCTCTCTC